MFEGKQEYRFARVQPYHMRNVPFEGDGAPVPTPGDKFVAWACVLGALVLVALAVAR